MEQGFLNGVVTIDLSKAFDLINHQILIRKLRIYQLDNNFVNLIRSYLTDRKQLISINGSTSQYQRMHVGVPQGSILGPLLFILFTNDINLSLHECESIIYANDTVLQTLEGQ